MVCTQICLIVKCFGLLVIKDFPPVVKHVVLPEGGGFDILGFPMWGSPDFLSIFVGSVVDCGSVLQAHLRDLEDPQAELLLLRSCLGLTIF